jgi:hypothetical protein
MLKQLKILNPVFLFLALALSQGAHAEVLPDDVALDDVSEQSSLVFVKDFEATHVAIHNSRWGWCYFSVEGEGTRPSHFFRAGDSLKIVGIKQSSPSSVALQFSSPQVLALHCTESGVISHDRRDLTIADLRRSLDWAVWVDGARR